MSVYIPVGVVVERCKAQSQWVDYLWRPVSVLAGEPSAAPWTMLASDAETTTYYAGPATVELHRGETANYLENVTSGLPMLWVILRPTGGEPAYEIMKVTADPSEGEGFTEAGNDLVEPVPMPASITEAVADFVAKHHVHRPFFKRQRERATPDSSGRRRHTESDNE